MRKMTYVRLWAVLLMAVLLPQAITAKVVMNFKEIVTGSEKVADMDGDGFDEIGTGSAVLDHDGTVLWTSGFGHGDALHLVGIYIRGGKKLYIRK